MENFNDQDWQQVEYYNSVPQESKPVEDPTQVIDYSKLVYCTVSWKRGVYKQVIKKFNDEKHFENWYDFISKRGGDVIGIDQPKEDDTYTLKTKR
jgi:hypothetical protein